MPKRGQRQPFRVDYVWDADSDNPVKGCVRFTYREQMMSFLEKQKRYAGDRQLDQTVTED